MATIDVQIWVDQHVYDHHGYAPADALQNLMADNFSYNDINSYVVGVNTEIPLDGRNFSGDTATRDIRREFQEWVDTNVGLSSQSSAHLIFDESDKGSWNGASKNGVSVAVGNRLANVSSIDPPRWAEINKGTGHAAGDAYHICIQEVGHDIGICGSGGCDGGQGGGSGHGCGMNYDDTYNVPKTSTFPGDGNDFVRTAMECPDDPANDGPNDCGTDGVQIVGTVWDKNWADAYYWYNCAGQCLRNIWN